MKQPYADADWYHASQLNIPHTTGIFSHTSYQPTVSTHLLSPPCQPALSTHPLTPPSQPTLSSPPLNPPSHHPLSTHHLTTPLNPPSHQASPKRDQIVYEPEDIAEIMREYVLPRGNLAYTES